MAETPNPNTACEHGHQRKKCPYCELIELEKEMEIMRVRLAWALTVVEAAKRVVDKCSRPGMKDPFDNGWQWYYRCQDALAAEPGGKT